MHPLSTSHIGPGFGRETLVQTSSKVHEISGLSRPFVDLVTTMAHECLLNHHNEDVHNKDAQ